MELELRTVTPLWTGGVDQELDRLHETGLLGSLRWWYEALVRGLRGQACDPTGNDRCPDDHGKRCVGCELFGCTGWARKFRLRVVDKSEELVQAGLRANTDLVLQLVELRPITDDEKWLLAKAVEVAAKYGALGGRTTLKPQRKRRAGADYGIVDWTGSRDVPRVAPAEAASYVRNSRWRDTQTRLPDLRWFFFVEGGFLWRSQLKSLMGRSEDGRPTGHEPYQEFLRGRAPRRGRGAVSKRVFSFRAAGGRVWGCGRDARMRDRIISEVRKRLGEGEYTVKTGEEVVSEL